MGVEIGIIAENPVLAEGKETIRTREEQWFRGAVTGSWPQWGSQEGTAGEAI